LDEIIVVGKEKTVNNAQALYGIVKTKQKLTA
jgi:hypothetical protein